MAAPTGGLGAGSPNVAATLVQCLRARGETVAVAESLTGGLLASALVAVPGASEVFSAGVVAYQTPQKSRLLGVSAELIATATVVSGPVALAMARGVREKTGSTWGIATTGVAGPAAVDAKAPGTFVVAVEGQSHSRWRWWQVSGGREVIRHCAAALGLILLLEVVNGAVGTKPPERPFTKSP